jgi:stress response protein SCP2
MNLQTLINETPGNVITIPPGVYEGPFLISRPVTLSGSGAVLISNEQNTAALNIESEGVRLFGLHIQAKNVNAPALLVREDTITEQVKVFGSVVGKADEEGFFDIPYALDAGVAASELPFEFTVKLNVPVSCSLLPSPGTAVSTEKLYPGENTVGIRLPGARDGSLIRRSVYVKTGLIREMVYTAFVSRKAEQKNYAPLLFEPAATDFIKPGITELLPKQTDSGQSWLRRGMHLPITAEEHLEIEYSGEADVFGFAHDGSGRLRDSRDLLFFGNDNAADGAVRFLNTAHRRAVFIDMKKLPAIINQFDAAYAFYNTANTSNPGYVRIKTSTGVYLIKTETDADVLIAFEINRRGSGFTLTPLLMPYRRGIKELITNYGLEVDG